MELLEKHATNCLIDRPRMRSHHCVEVQCRLAGLQEQSEGVGVLRRCENSFVHLKPVHHKALKPMSFGSFRLHIFAGHRCSLGGKCCYRNHNEAVRLRSLQASQGLTKKEMRQLNALLQRDPGDLLESERRTLMSLAETAGADLSSVISRKEQPSSSSSAMGWRDDGARETWLIPEKEEASKGPDRPRRASHPAIYVRRFGR